MFPRSRNCSNDYLPIDDYHTVLSTNRLRFKPCKWLGKVANGPGNVTASRGQYIHDTTSDEYFLAKSDVTIDLTDSTIISGDLESNANLNMVALTERSDGNVFLLGDDLPTEGKELSYFSDRALVAKAGDYVYDPATKDYYWLAKHKQACRLDRRILLQLETWSEEPTVFFIPQKRPQRHSKHIE